MLRVVQYATKYTYISIYTCIYIYVYIFFLYILYFLFLDLLGFLWGDVPSQWNAGAKIDSTQGSLLAVFGESYLVGTGSGSAVYKENQLKSYIISL